MLLLTVYQEFHEDEGLKINFFEDVLKVECPEESFSITRSVISRDLNARVSIYPELTDLVVPLTGFWIFCAIGMGGLCISFAVELLIGCAIRKGNTECICIWYIISCAYYTAFALISAICESVVYSKAGDYYEGST